MTMKRMNIDFMPGMFVEVSWCEYRKDKHAYSLQFYKRKDGPVITHYMVKFNQYLDRHIISERFAGETGISIDNFNWKVTERGKL